MWIGEKLLIFIKLSRRKVSDLFSWHTYGGGGVLLPVVATAGRSLACALLAAPPLCSCPLPSFPRSQHSPHAAMSLHSYVLALSDLFCRGVKGRQLASQLLFSVSRASGRPGQRVHPAAFVGSRAAAAYKLGVSKYASTPRCLFLPPVFQPVPGVRTSLHTVRVIVALSLAAARGHFLH